MKKEILGHSPLMLFPICAMGFDEKDGRMKF